MLGIHFIYSWIKEITKINVNRVFITHVTTEFTIHRGSAHQPIMATAEAIPARADGEYPWLHKACGEQDTLNVSKSHFLGFNYTKNKP